MKFVEFILFRSLKFLKIVLSQKYYIFCLSEMENIYVFGWQIYSRLELPNSITVDLSFVLDFTETIFMCFYGFVMYACVCLPDC